MVGAVVCGILRVISDFFSDFTFLVFVLIRCFVLTVRNAGRLFFELDSPFSSEWMIISLIEKKDGIFITVQVVPYNRFNIYRFFFCLIKMISLPHPPSLLPSFLPSHLPQEF